MSTSDEIFYLNVYLLSQAVPTSKDFDALFSKDMFRKQNTPGLLHITHYLLNIYDANLCKKMIPWPLLSKQDESQFRNKVVKFFSIIQKENPDFTFPSGISACLFQATGTKFMIIMELLSTVAVKKFVQKIANDVHIPEFTKDLRILSISKLNDPTIENIKAISESSKEDFEPGNDFITERRKEIDYMKHHIYVKKAILTELLKAVPSMAWEDKRKLENYQSNCDVIESWYNFILNKIIYWKKCINFKKLLCDQQKSILDMIHINASNSMVLDKDVLVKINSDEISTLLDPEYEIIARRLYDNDELVLTNFLIIYTHIMQIIRNKFHRFGFSDIAILSQTLKESSEDLKTMSKVIDVKKSDCTDLQMILQCHKHVSETSLDNSLQNVNEHKMVFAPITPVHVQTLTNNQETEHVKNINLTPILSFDQSLFSKYKSISVISDPTPGLNTIKNNSLIRVNLNNTIQSSRINFLATQRHDRCKSVMKSSKKIFQKYCKLFNPSSSNVLLDETLILPKAHSTAVMNTSSEIETSLKLKKNLIEQINTADEKQEVPSTTVQDMLQTKKERQVETEKVSKKRLSISDLLDRYKTLKNLK